MADGFYFANGLTLDRDEDWIYVAETTGRVMWCGSRSGRTGHCPMGEIYGPAPLDPVGIPDGIAFDEAGNLWITFPNINSVGLITPEGEWHLVLEDPYYRIIRRPTNICFGGPDRRTAFLGSLDGDNIPCFQAPRPGMRLVHQK